jgi:hypothetical protein
MTSSVSLPKVLESLLIDVMIDDANDIADADIYVIDADNNQY